MVAGWANEQTCGVCECATVPHGHKKHVRKSRENPNGNEKYEDEHKKQHKFTKLVTITKRSSSSIDHDGIDPYSHQSNKTKERHEWMIHRMLSYRIHTTTTIKLLHQKTFIFFSKWISSPRVVCCLIFILFLESSSSPENLLSPINTGDGLHRHCIQTWPMPRCMRPNYTQWGNKIYGILVTNTDKYINDTHKMRDALEKDPISHTSTKHAQKCH